MRPSSRHARTALLTALLGSALALVAGPALAVLDVLGVLPIDVRDSAGPLLVVAGAACCAAVAAAAICGPHRRPMLTLGIAVSALTSCAGVRQAVAGALPPSSPDFAAVSTWPDVVLRDDADAAFPLRSLRGAPVVVVFFKGATCPYCRAQLRAFAEDAPRYLSVGVRVVAISPDPSAALPRLRAELGPALTLLSDEEQRSSALYCGGRTHCIVVADPDGATRWAGVSESWSDVPAPELLLQAAHRTRALN